MAGRLPAHLLILHGHRVCRRRLLALALLLPRRLDQRRPPGAEEALIRWVALHLQRGRGRGLSGATRLLQERAAGGLGGGRVAAAAAAAKSLAQGAAGQRARRPKLFSRRGGAAQPRAGALEEAARCSGRPGTPARSAGAHLHSVALPRPPGHRDRCAAARRRRCSALSSLRRAEACQGGPKRSQRAEHVGCAAAAKPGSAPPRCSQWRFIAAPRPPSQPLWGRCTLAVIYA